MATLLVTYDLHTPSANSAALLAAIKSTDWAKLGGSSYLVATAETPEQLRNRLIQHLRANDKLYVGVAPAPSAWFNLPEEVSRWILARQR